MKTSSEKFLEVVSMFPKLDVILNKLDDADVIYNIGGSVSLYVQGNTRKPKDVDIMFTDAAFDRANNIFNLNPEFIDRPYNSMNKSSPTDDGSIDFLNQYTSKAGDQSYYSPPIEYATVRFNNKDINLVPAEKIAVFKLISRRDHHSDLNDFNDLFTHPDFDVDVFWRIVDSLDARKIVEKLL